MTDTSAAALTGVQRAAVLLLSLGEQDAAEVLKHMNAKEVQKLGIAMASVSGVTSIRSTSSPGLIRLSAFGLASRVR